MNRKMVIKTTGMLLLAEACLILFCLAPLLCLSDGALAPGAALCLPLGGFTGRIAR